WAKAAQALGCRADLPRAAESLPETVMSVIAAKSSNWRTPVLVLLCGCVISLVSFGPRATLGFFLTPQSQANGWGRDTFAFALAIQNILWGLGQPLAGMLADRFGIVRVLCVGAICYAIGLATMAYATTPLMLDISPDVFT